MTTPVRRLSALSVRARIAAGFGLLILLMGTGSALYDHRLRDVSGDLERVVASADVSSTFADFDESVLLTRLAVRRYLTTPVASSRWRPSRR